MSLLKFIQLQIHESPNHPKYPAALYIISKNKLDWELGHYGKIFEAASILNYVHYNREISLNKSRPFKEKVWIYSDHVGQFRE